MRRSRILLPVVAALFAVMASAGVAGSAEQAASVSADDSWQVSRTGRWYSCDVVGTYTINAVHFGLVASECYDVYLTFAAFAEGGPNVPAPWDGKEYHFVILNGLHNGAMDMLKQDFYDNTAVAKGWVRIFTTGEPYPELGRAIKVTRVMKVAAEELEIQHGIGAP